MKKSRIVPVTIVILGLVFTLSLWSLILKFDSSVIAKIAGFLELSLVGIGLSFILVGRVIWPRWQWYAFKTRLIWISICLFAGFFLVYEIPVTVDPYTYTLRVIATGDKNLAAKGNEVWLSSVNAGQRTPSQKLTRICRGNWLPKDGLWFIQQPQQSELVCKVKTDDDEIFVTFGMHPWSGMVNLVFEGQTTTLDLYSENGELKEAKFQISRSGIQHLVMCVLFLADGISMGVLLLAVSVWFITRTSEQPTDPDRKPTPWYRYALLPATSWFIYMLAFWPGFVSLDTVSQLQQITLGSINNWHPAFHTITLWLITRLWYSTAAVIILQILILSALIGWGLSLIEGSGAPAWLSWSTSGFLAFSPASSLLILNPWKDIAYSIAVLALTLLIFRIILSNGGWIVKSGSWAILGIVTALTALYRHNGSPVAFGTLAGFILGYRRYWKPLLAATALALALWAGVRGPLYQVVGVNTSDETLEGSLGIEILGRNLGIEANAYYLVRHHVLSGTPLLPEEMELFQEICPQNEVNLVTLSKYSKDVNRLAIKVTLRNPVPTLDFLSQKGTFIFQILQPPRSRVGYVGLVVDENSFGLKPDSKLPQLQKLFTALASKTETPEWDWLFWRNAFWMYLLSLGTIVACVRRRSWKYILLLVPVLLNALPLSVLIGSQIARYIFPTLLIGPMFSGYLLLIQPSQDHRDSRIDLPGGIRS